MKILIIGGNGYTGSALYKHLSSKGFFVDSVDLCLFGKDLGYSIKQNYSKISIENYSHIILLAAHSSVNMCKYNKNNAWLNNVEYFRDLCNKLNDKQVLLYASSASVYGQKHGLSNESCINLFPINDYDLTKITNDIIANYYIKNNKNIVGMRFGTVNGRSINIRSDLMINSMYKAYKESGKIFVKNPLIHRPILAIKDLVRAIECVIVSNNIISGQYNLNSFNSTVNEIAENFKSILNCEIVYQENDSIDSTYDFMIDNSLFEKTFNFKFEETIESIILGLQKETLLEKFCSRNEDNLFNCYI